MRKSNILTGLVLLIIVILMGLGIGWLATRTDGPPIPPVTVVPVTAPEPVPVSRPPSTRPPLPSRPAPTVTVPGTESMVQALPSSGVVITNWEDRLDEILGSEDEDTNKVHQLLAMFPSLPADGQDEVAQHLSNLVEDEAYAELGKLLLDSKLPEPVLDTLLADLLNRPNETKLPMFLEIAFTPNHSKAAESKDLLELYLDEDFGTDRLTWENKMRAWLKENPD